MNCARCVPTYSWIMLKHSVRWGQDSRIHLCLVFWDDPIGSFVRFNGTLVEHMRGTQTGSCPLCNVQEDQHDYAVCLWTASIELQEGELNITTSRRHRGDPPLNPNSMGPTPGTALQVTPKNPQPVPES